jgi:histidyl-tRNA synthetase
MDFSERSMKAQMKSASARKARLACILGENELAGGTVTVKDLNSGEQKEISADSIVEEVQKILSAGKD